MFRACYWTTVRRQIEMHLDHALLAFFKAQASRLMLSSFPEHRFVLGVYSSKTAPTV